MEDAGITMEIRLLHEHLASVRAELEIIAATEDLAVDLETRAKSLVAVYEVDALPKEEVVLAEEFGITGEVHCLQDSQEWARFQHTLGRCGFIKASAASEIKVKSSLGIIKRVVRLTADVVSVESYGTTGSLPLKDGIIRRGDSISAVT